MYTYEGQGSIAIHLGFCFALFFETLWGVCVLRQGLSDLVLT